MFGKWLSAFILMGSLSMLFFTSCQRSSENGEGEGEEPQTHVHHILKEGEVAPSCTQSGFTAREWCDECGVVLQYSNEIPAKGHDYDENNVCRECSFHFYPYTQGMEFALTVDENAYYVASMSETAEHIVIPPFYNGKPVVGIGKYAFYGTRQALKSVEIPEGITYIENSAFRECDSLESITLPQTLNFLGDGVFSKCTNLREISIPNGVTVLSQYLFSECSSLVDVEFGSGIICIQQYAFAKCKSLVEIIIPEGVEEIQQQAFGECLSLQTVSLPESIASIDGFYSFLGCQNIEYTLLGGCLYLGNNGNPYSVLMRADYSLSENFSIHEKTNVFADMAFFGCERVQSIIIPTGVKSIGAKAFAGCSLLQSLSVPESVTKIGEGAFSQSGIESIVLPSKITELANGLFMSCSFLKEITIPSGVTRIGPNAFWGSAIEEIVIPESVQSIGDSAFYGCKSLKKLTVSGDKSWEVTLEKQSFVVTAEELSNPQTALDLFLNDYAYFTWTKEQ